MVDVYWTRLVYTCEWALLDVRSGILCDSHHTLFLRSQIWVKWVWSEALVLPVLILLTLADGTANRSICSCSYTLHDFT